jgi:phosphoglycerol transferase MdoB-like AlkP superfamily enzyme
MAKTDSQYGAGRSASVLGWLLLPLVFLIARLGSTLIHFSLNTPHGGPITENVWKFTSFAWPAEAGSFLLVFGLFGLMAARFRKAIPRGAFFLVLVFLLGYAIIAEFDVHLRRWMGLRLSLVFLRHLSHAANSAGFWQTLVGYLKQDAFAVVLSVAFVVIPVVIALRNRNTIAEPRSRRLLAATTIAGVLLLVFSTQRGIAMRKWRLVAPWPYALSMDVWRAAVSDREPPTAAAFDELRALVGVPAAAKREFPLWRDSVPAPTATAHKGFDVVLVAVESLRGWAADLRSPEAQQRLPNLAHLYRERGVFFPHAHSNGYPSGEGNMNLHLGIWSHPERAVAAEHVGISSRALPEILRDHGYKSRWFAGSDPSFDNLQHFMGRWFDGWELVLGGDDKLVTRAIEVYEELGDTAPRFISIYTASTHPFYELPATEGPKPDDSDAAYLKALSFADRALGRMFDVVAKAGRMDRTLFIVTGDHAQPNAWHLEHDSDVGLPNAGRTWTSMLIAGPDLPRESVRVDASSHVDVPPTILGYLGISVPNHFFGRDLFSSEPARPVIAVFSKGVAIIEGDTMIVGGLESDTITKFQYDTGPNSAPASYQHGKALPEAPADLERFRSVGRAVRAFAWTIDHDQLRPPSNP